MFYLIELAVMINLHKGEAPHAQLSINYVLGYFENFYYLFCLTVEFKVACLLAFIVGLFSS